VALPATEPAARFGLLLIDEFFDAAAREEIVAEMRAAWGGPATVYRPRASSPVDESLRKTTRKMLSEATTERVRRRLLERREEVGRHFGVALTDCEAPQFLLYREGDFFVAHQDGNTEQLQFDHLRVRRVSVVIFLGRQTPEPEPGAYCGGSLVFYEPDADPARKELGFPLAGRPGLLVAFRAETTHEVVPVTHGERHSIVCWYR
jgi:SM-20-related protein